MPKVAKADRPVWLSMVIRYSVDGALLTAATVFALWGISTEGPSKLTAVRDGESSAFIPAVEDHDPCAVQPELERADSAEQQASQRLAAQRDCGLLSPSVEAGAAGQVPGPVAVR